MNKLKKRLGVKRNRKHKYTKHHKNRYATQGRYVGYFRGSKRGSTFSEARRYCKRKYGGLASIGSKKENNQVK